MSKYLREEKREIDGVKLTLVELNASAQRQMLKANAEAELILAMAWAVKYGTKEFREMEPEQILDELPMSLLQKIGEEVAELSGFDEDPAKNSESGLSDVSSSA